MRPLHLRLQNFISYQGEHELDLSSIDLAVISGNNGHGKSALLDSITWVLFGEARKGSGSRKPDGDIINESELSNKGESRMEAELEFRTGQEYYKVLRVYRETASGKTTNSELKLWHTDAKGTELQDLTTGSQRQTQAEIIDILGMNYELFSSTTLFEQGRWNQLMEATPGERRDIFFDLLQLDRFEDLEEQAKEKRRELDSDLEQARSRLKYLEEDYEGWEDLTRQRQALLQREAEIEAAIISYESELEDKRKQAREQARLENQIANKKERVQETERRQEQLAEDLFNLKADLQEMRSREELLESKIHTDDLDQWLDELKQKKTKLQSQRQRREEIQGTIEELEAERDELASPLDEFDKTLEEVVEGLYEEQADLERKISQLQPGDQTHDERVEKLSSELASVRGRLESKREIREERKQKLEGIEPGDPCPTCQQELTSEHIDDLSVEGPSEAEKELEQRERQLEKGLQEAKEDRQRTNDLRTRLDDVEWKLSELNGLDEDLQKIDSRIKSKKQRLKDLDTDADKLSGLRSKINELETEKNAQRKLEEVQRDIQSQESRIESKEEEIEEIEQSLEELSEELEQLREEAEKLPDAREQVEQLESELDRERDAFRQCSNERESIGTQLDSKLESKAEAKEQEQQVQELREDYQTYDDLAQALGRNGLPAMIFETAIPHIESRANQMLDDLSGGEYQIRLRTTRETQDGGETDTMDVIILSEGQERPYEILSGGERFRTAFALRVALSQHLAERSGRQIETLIIDEGFGTQDRENRQTVQETIAEAAEQFDLVLAITHVQQLKNSFPQRIHVQKDHSGSQVNVY